MQTALVNRPIRQLLVSVLLEHQDKPPNLVLHTLVVTYESTYETVVHIHYSPIPSISTSQLSSVFALQPRKAENGATYIRQMLEEGIHERIVGTIFECTEHHQTIAMFQSWRTFFMHTVLDTLYKTDLQNCV